MKFFSKMNANLMIVLKQGLPGNAQLGTTTTPGLYARFQNGHIDITDETMIKLMLAHPGFNSDFVRVEEAEADPYAAYRKSSEPAHVISAMTNGHPERIVKGAAPVTPELKALLTEMALELAKPMALELSRQMLPSMVQETILALQQQQTGGLAQEIQTVIADAPKKAGRPKKVAETPA